MKSNLENPIQNFTAMMDALAAFNTAKVNKIGARKQGQMSRSMSKPTNVIGVFLYGGSYEFHASMTDGRYSGWIWLYKDGVLAHEGKNHDVNTFVADIHQKIKAQ